MGNKMPTFGLSFNGMSASSMKAEARSPHLLVRCSCEKGLYVCILGVSNQVVWSESMNPCHFA